MRSIRRELPALAVGLAAFVAPILLSLQLAWRQSIADEKAENSLFASEVVRRSEKTADQFGRAIQILNHDHFARCSPQELDLMRQVDVGSSYIQMVGRISGNTIECTSLGTSSPIDAGHPDLVTSHGVSERINFKLGSQPLDRLDLVDFSGVAILIDTNLLVDLQTAGDDVAVAVVVPSSPARVRLVEPKIKFQPSWFNPVAPGQSVSFIDGQSVVSQVRSKTLDVEAVTVMPLRYGSRHVRQFALIFVPIGLVCGVGLGWAVLQISRARSSLPGLLRSAARHKSFYVEYQPVVEMATRRIVGAEALVRWKRGDTVISPASFISLAEESGVISLITQNVMEIVARDLPRLIRLDPDFCVAINLSATDLKSRATIDRLSELLQKSGASPGNLLVEATEHGFLTGPEPREITAAIRALGICVAIDDFGTGYSSLSRLQSLNLDYLKIDKAFVDTIATDGATSQVVVHIIEMAQSLHLKTVAEGVETETQAEFLNSRKVAYAQGWLFGRPTSLDNLCTQISKNISQIEEQVVESSAIPG